VFQRHDRDLDSVKTDRCGTDLGTVASFLAAHPEE
jgi:hypothetical protein